ncbi:ABC transporter ATP-binding protein/permease [Patescibacteria group bacterium]|nr:ABC transporter ATP-binding protein/permease [Patescibacteria group bacterium]
MEYNTRKTLEIYLAHAGKYKLWGSIILFFVISGAATNVITPLFYKKFFDTLVSGQIKEEIVSGLISVLALVLVIKIAGWISWRAADFMSVKFQRSVIADLSNTCFKYLHKHSFSYFNNNFTGSLVKRVSYFPRAFEEISDRIAWNFLPLVVSIVIIIAVLFSKNILLGAVILLWLFIVVALNWFLAKYKLKYDIKVSEAYTEATGFLSDTITNNSNVKLFCGFKREVVGFAGLNERIRKLSQFSWNLNGIFEAVQVFFIVMLEIGMFYIGIGLWEKGNFTIGDFVLLQAYIIIIFQNTINLGKMIRMTYHDLADAEEMTVILNTPHEIIDVPKAKDLKVTEGKIEFKDVDFYYHMTRKIFEKFSLSIASRERVALIGPSGAGKTTVVKLLLRNHDISRGNILVDGQNISKVTQESLWKNISLVPQDPILFHRTLLENIRYGKPEAADEEVVRAAKLAHCHEFISSFPKEYDTYVGERGVKLSGGERQRVAIARAILRNSPVLVLDEATSSLDSESESLIQDALVNLMKDKTVIVIAHRLSTIAKMNRIIFIDNGEIKESGTHEDLLGIKNGKYRKLWELQACGFIAE